MPGDDLSLPTPEELAGESVAALARRIRADWKKPYFGAVPYLDAMQYVHADHVKYGADTADSIVVYFLSNATTWRGPLARLIKAELKRRFKIK